MEYGQLAVVFGLITALLTAFFQIIVRKGKNYGNALTGVLIGIIVNFPIMVALSYITWEPEWFNAKAIMIFAATGIFGPGVGRCFLFLSLHKIGVAIKNGKNACFSFLYSPGAINFQICIAINGNAKNKAKKKAIFNSVKKASCKAV